MILKTVYVRFYRAFNFDYLRKRHSDATPDPWDCMKDGTFYPYVKLDIDPELTAIVGANESGKSQLLQAVEYALGKGTPAPGDFCRYSEFFTVAEAMNVPHFGLHFNDLTKEEAIQVTKLVQLSEDADVSSFRVFRTSAEKATLYIAGKSYEVDDLGFLDGILPKVFRIDPQRAIPNSVPISYLAAGGKAEDADPGLSRTARRRIVQPIIDSASAILAQLRDPTALGSTVQAIFDDAEVLASQSERESKAYHDQMKLAYDLLVTVGGIHVSAFVRLQEAIGRDDQGLANGIMSSMNDQLEKSLNLAKWWSQDRRFRLSITVREFDLVFTIRDRTGSEYSFAERSYGLRYFLSYLVQFLAHVRDRVNSEILLMDEPDAYLSNQGQQDLLRVLQEFTYPTEGAPGGQVVFVTHSPFLIDKNRGDRIRVLDKGSSEEGVRVVRDIGRNHFEPLRTALGGFVGETAFIGNCNLILEGLADQVYLAGMSELLSREGVASTERLDLNRITLVPAGSASHVPYMTFLARGRDTNKPAVIVLLDGDSEGDIAVRSLKRGGPRNKQLIRPEYLAQLKPCWIPCVTSERPGGPLELEDLVPIEIGLEAVKRYLDQMEMEIPRGFPSVDTVRGALSDSKGIFKAIQEALAEAGSELHLEKLGFARHVMDVCKDNSGEPGTKMRIRFRALMSQLTYMQRIAERERERESIAARVDREKALFFRDRLQRATKSDVTILLERIVAVVDSSIEGDALLTDVRRMREEFELHQNPNDPIADPSILRERIEKLKYSELMASQPKSQSSNGTARVCRQNNLVHSTRARIWQIARKESPRLA